MPHARNYIPSNSYKRRQWASGILHWTCRNPFKERYYNHISSFNDKEKRHHTTLSDYIWTLNDKKIKHSITWKLIAKASAYSPSSQCCYLCIKEKYFIICKSKLATLNSKSELVSACRHRRKHLLSNFK